MERTHTPSRRDFLSPKAHSSSTHTRGSGLQRSRPRSQGLAGGAGLRTGGPGRGQPPTAGVPPGRGALRPPRGAAVPDLPAQLDSQLQLGPQILSLFEGRSAPKPKKAAAPPRQARDGSQRGAVIQSAPRAKQPLPGPGPPSSSAPHPGEESPPFISWRPPGSRPGLTPPYTWPP